MADELFQYSQGNIQRLEDLRASIENHLDNVIGPNVIGLREVLQELKDDARDRIHSLKMKTEDQEHRLRDLQEEAHVQELETTCPGYEYGKECSRC